MSIKFTKEILVTKSSMPPFEEYVEMIKPLWESHWLTNMGLYHQKLEDKLKDFCEIEEVSLMVNGHMALELVIQAMNFPMGSEVITTPFTFVSTTHAIVRNHLEPIFCDIKEDFTIDENKIESLITEKTVAIVPVHVYGNICNIEKIEHIAYKYGLKVIYDAAHAFGEIYKGKNVASFGDASVFSFHATKVFNSIEGGCVCSHSRELYNKLYNLKNFGIRSEELIVSVGANAKMNEFVAAMGLCNLKYFNDEVCKRKQSVILYRKLLGDSKFIKLNQLDENTRYNYAYMPVLFDNQELRDRAYDNLKKNGVHARKYFYPITSDEVCFKNKYKDVGLSMARDYAQRVLVLPLYADIQEETIIRICEILLN